MSNSDWFGVAICFYFIVGLLLGIGSGIHMARQQKRQYNLEDLMFGVVIGVIAWPLPTLYYAAHFFIQWVNRRMGLDQYPPPEPDPIGAGWGQSL